MIDEKIERMCLCKLTDKELQQRGDEMAAQELLIEKLSAERSRLSAQVREHKAARAQLAHVIDSKAEQRPVACVWQTHRPTSTMILLRTDTRQEIERRPITAADRQPELPLGDGGGGANGAKRKKGRSRKAA